MQNDKIAALLAELRYGRALRQRDALLLYLDEGISLGLLSNGRIHQGHNRLCGEFGHINVNRDGPFCYCGSRGCLESVASTWAMIREMRSMIDGGVNVGVEDLVEGRPIGLETISAAAQQGVVLARNLLGRAGDLIGGLLTTVANIFDPEKIILAGKLSQTREHPHLIQHLRDAFHESLHDSQSLPIALEPSLLENRTSP